MMNQARIQDTLQRGLGRGARVVGTPHFVHRCPSVEDPLDPANRVLLLSAAFLPESGRWERSVPAGQALWQGMFDSAETRPGDYLVNARTGETWFIAAQYALLLVLCIRCNGIVSLSRPAPQTASGVNAYGGVQTTNLVPLLRNFPASILAAGGTGLDANLPGDVNPGAWTVLLPPTGHVVPAQGDLLTDALGRTAVIGTTEHTNQSWRLLARQSTT
jgi:hypothetical protein